MSLPVAVYVARIGDLLHEARAELTEDEFADLLAVAAAAIAKHVADQIEGRWTTGR